LSNRPGHPEHDTPRVRTRTDTSARTWLGDDKVTRLREWESDKVHQLPGGDVSELVIGSDPSADLPLVDPSGKMSRSHARLTWRDGVWQIKDLRSTNGIHIDGIRGLARRFLIVPGLEIGIGGVVLIAENETMVRLRGYLARVLGWDAASRPAINLAVRAIRAAANRRSPLVIAGADDLVAVARQIHVRTAASTAPFVVCGKRPDVADGSVRVTASIADASTAFASAAGGTVCVRADRPPKGYDKLRQASAAYQSAAQLFICAKTAKQAARRVDLLAPPILVPKLARRKSDDIHRIVFEYALDALRELDAPPTAFSERERKWVARHEASSFADIEIATLRIVARNVAGSTHQAAARLGLSHVGLGKWFNRRKLTR
jgi:hypothetical protein